MKLVEQSMGVALAITAASLIGGCNSNPTKPVSTDSVHCSAMNKCGSRNDSPGVNDCASHSGCKAASNACKGIRSPKGEGFVIVSRQACSEMGGTAS